MAEGAAPLVVVGPGAVGTMLAARLAQGGHGRRVYLAGSRNPGDRTRAHLDAIAAGGVRVHGEAPCAAQPLARRGALDRAASHLLFAVKAGDVGDAAREFVQMAGPETIAAVFSNGLDVCENLPAAYRECGVVRGLVQTGAEIKSPGRLSQFGALEVALAPGPGGARGVGRLAALLEAAGVRVRRVRDAKEAEWRKAAANAVINPLGTLLELKNGALLDTPSAAARVEVLSGELQRLVDAEGMALPVLEIVRGVARATAGNRNSMWQDVMRGRRSEIREVTGRLLARADARGVSMPAHKSLYCQILALEPRRSSAREGGCARVDRERRSP